MALRGRRWTLALAAAHAACAADEGGEEHAIERQDWSFGGFTGQYDKAQLQRGFQVYQQVCTACHGLKRVRFRNLAEPGGPEFPEASVKALAAAWPYQISGELDDQGNPIDRLPGLADPIVGPYKNDVQARAAQNGALPPDLSLIAKARAVESHAPLVQPVALHAARHRDRLPGGRRRTTSMRCSPATTSRRRACR